MYSKKIVLRFPSQQVDKPIIYRLSRDFNLEFNILKAFVTPKEEGLMVLELKGSKKDYDSAVKYLEKEGLKIQSLSKDVIRNEEKCVHCGVCIPVCPVLAFEVDNVTKKITFNKNKCIACELCVGVCPYKAITVEF